MPALGPDSCHNVGPVFRKPGHGLRPVDDTLVGVPGGIFQGFWLKSLRRILNEIMQALVSSSALEGFCDGRTGPPTLGQIYDPRSVSLAEPRCGIELKTEVRAAVWQVAWIRGFLRSPASNLRQHCTSEFHIAASHAIRLSPNPPAGSPPPLAWRASGRWQQSPRPSGGCASLRDAP